MTEQRWEKWFTKQLNALHRDPDAGFVVLVYVSVMLERAGRIELGIKPTESFGAGAPFFAFLQRVVPDLGKDPDPVAAENFWGVVRNGLAHDLAASKGEYQGISLTTLTINHGLDRVCKYDGSTLEVSPRRYADAVVGYVTDTLTVARFLGGNSASDILPLPTVAPVEAVGGAVPEMLMELTKSGDR